MSHSTRGGRIGKWSSSRASFSAPITTSCRRLVPTVVWLRVQRGRQAGQHVGDVADQLDVGDEVLVDLGGDAVDHDDLLVAARVPVLGRVLDQVVADRDHQVGVVEAGHLVVAGLEADRAERLRVLVVDQPLGHERLGHGDAGVVDERAQRAGGVAADRAVAGQRHRVLRRRRSGRRPAGAPCCPARAERGRDGAAARRRAAAAMTSSGSSRWVAPGFSDSATANALRTTSGMISGARDPSVPLNDRAQDADEVYVLVRFLVHALDVGLTGQGDQRSAIQEGVGHGSDQVRRPWAEGPQAYASPAGQPAVGVGHVRPALLVPDGDELNRRIGQGLAQVERFLPRNPEDVPNPFRLQALDENL